MCPTTCFISFINCCNVALGVGWVILSVTTVTAGSGSTDSSSRLTNTPSLAAGVSVPPTGVASRRHCSNCCRTYPMPSYIGNLPATWRMPNQPFIEPLKCAPAGSTWCPSYLTLHTSVTVAAYTQAWASSFSDSWGCNRLVHSPQ